MNADATRNILSDLILAEVFILKAKTALILSGEHAQRTQFLLSMAIEENSRVQNEMLHMLETAQ